MQPSLPGRLATLLARAYLITGDKKSVKCWGSRRVCRDSGHLSINHWSVSFCLVFWTCSRSEWTPEVSDRRSFALTIKCQRNACTKPNARKQLVTCSAYFWFRCNGDHGILRKWCEVTSKNERIILISKASRRVWPLYVACMLHRVFWIYGARRHLDIIHRV